MIKVPQSAAIFVPGAGANALLNPADAVDWSLSVIISGSKAAILSDDLSTNNLIWGSS